MNGSLKIGVVVCLLAGVSVATLVAARRTFAATPEKYLHIRVNDSDSKETVNVNLPLSLAEKIIPTINHGDLKNGRISIGHADMNDVDVHAILEAVRNSPDGEFVTVKSDTENVRVAKSNGNLIIHVHDFEKPKAEKDADKNKDGDKKADRDNEENEKVEIRIPMSVVNALVPNDKKEVDVVGAIHAMAEAGESLLVTVHDATSDVRIWVDSNGSGSEK